MKKKFLVAAVLTVALGLSGSALGTDLLVSPGPATLSLTVEVEGKALDLTGKSPYMEGEIIMLPVRAVGETLGYTVTWSADAPDQIKLDNGKVNTIVYIGSDSYYMASSTAIGMSKPSPLGAVPTVNQGTTFVPMGLFKLLGNGAVKNESVISLTAEGNKTQIPNPIKEYATTEEAAKAAGLTLDAMPKLPAEYSQQSVYLIGTTLLEVNYSDGKSKISYRVAAGTEDVSGDYTVYTQVLNETIGTKKVTTKGADGLITLATWQTNGSAHALRMESPVTLSALSAMIG